MSSSTTTINSIGGVTSTIFTGFNFKFILYLLVAIIIEIIVIVYATRSNQYLTVAIFAPISLYVFIVYGLRWFGADSPYPQSTVNWPPIINSCPDFLVAYNIPNTKTTGCVDVIGIAPGDKFKQNKSGIPTFGSGSTAQPTGSISSTVAATAYNSVGWFPTKVPNETKADLCTRLRTAGLTWDGVFDGANCLSSTGSLLSGQGTAGTCT